MADLHFNSNADCDPSESLPRSEKEILERALAKLVLAGEQVGIDAAQMIQLLDDGMTVKELLELVLAMTGERLPDGAPGDS
jgi:hypothetical protein